MQTPKFRAWHKRLNHMYPVSYLQWNNGNMFDIFLQDTVVSVYPHEIELMQWTGFILNNQEIYVGDILKYDNDKLPSQWQNSEHLFEVKWSQSECMFVINNLKTNGFFGLSQTEDMFFIGNIYENPELLNEEI